jgi:hypothetical protein
VAVLALGICGAPAVTPKDSADFNLQLEMNVVPPNAYGTVHKGWTSDGEVLTVNNLQNAADGAFGWTSQFTHSMGYTMELRYQISQANYPSTNSSFKYTFQFEGVDGGGTGSLHVLEIGAPFAGSELGVYSQFGILGLPITAGQWHTLRIAQDANTTALLVWSDGMDVSSFNWQSGNNTSVNRAWIGDLGTAVTDGIYLVDYLRADNTGAYSPTNAVALSAPGLVQSPQSATNILGASITLSGRFSGLLSGLQWYQDGVPLLNATNLTYVINPATDGNTGWYALSATNAAGVTNTAPAYVQVLDVDPGPAVQSVQGTMTLENVRVIYTEPMIAATVTNIANYSFQGAALNVLSARLIDQYTVELGTSFQTPGSNYTLFITNVLDILSNPIVANTGFSFTGSAIVPAARYDAGTTTTQPSGPPDPAQSSGGYWLLYTNGDTTSMSVGSAANDLSTGFNAWTVIDQNTTSGVMDYNMAIDQPTKNLARSNGWRLATRSRMVDNFGTFLNDQIVLYSDPSFGFRYGMFFLLDASGNLNVSLLGGATYPLADSSTATAYHTHVLIYDAASGAASYYFDSQLIAKGYGGQANTTYDGVVFGSASSTQEGQMNYNLVEFDIATLPVWVGHLDISLNSGNVVINYTDVLEAASQASGVYSGVATNSSSSTTNTYVIPSASQQSQQFFRVRKLP